MRKYVINAVDLEISKDEESHDDQGSKLIAASQKASNAPRNLMRGFELIFKIFELIKLSDWLKIKNLTKILHNYHF